MKIMTSREERATMTAMIGMSSGWLLSTETRTGGRVYYLNQYNEKGCPQYEGLVRSFAPIISIKQKSR